MSAAPKFIATRRVEFHETDMAGIVHFACFYKYMEEAEHQYFRSLGLSILRTHDDGTATGWPRVSAKCSFEAPARYEDELEIRISLERLGVKSLTLSYEFWRDDARLAQGQMKTVCCRFAHGQPLRSIEIPPEVAEKFA